MRILHLSSEFPPQSVFGLGRYVDELSRCQSRSGHFVEVVTNSFGGMDSEKVIDGVCVSRVHFPPPPKAPNTSAMLLHFNLQLVERCVKRKIKSVDQERYDVINAHDWLTVPAAFHLGKLLDTPVVTTLHDIIFNKVHAREFNSDDAYIAGVENWACHTSSAIIVLSESVRKEILASYHVARDRVHVIPGGVGITPIIEDELHIIAAWRAKLAPNDEDLFLYAGRLDPEKGLRTLINAALQLRKIRQDGWKLLIAGSGQLKDQLEDFCSKNGLSTYVAFLGYLPFDQLRMAYAMADASVVPSDYEPFGLVALEAQRMGTPVIAANTGGLSETMALTHGGLTFSPGNASELCECMIQMLGQQRRIEFAQRGQENVREHFNWDSISQRITDVLAESSRSGRPPTDVAPPAWEAPSRMASCAPDPTRTTPCHPACNLTLFWDVASPRELGPILERLSGAHALKALNGMIDVIPVAVGPANLNWEQPFSGPRVRYLTDQALEKMSDSLRSSAAVIVDSRVATRLLNSKIIAANKIPTLWIGEVASELGGQIVRDMNELYSYATKLLCDDSLRRQLSIHLDNPLPCASWKAADESMPLICHVLPQLVTGGAETMLLELTKGTKDSYKHHILCLGPEEGPLPGEFRQMGVEITTIPHVAPDQVLNFFQQIRPNLLHLHSMSYVPGWIAIHRCLTAQAIVETEHVVNIGSGHFGPVDVVACVSEAARLAHKPFESIFRQSAQRVQVIYNGIDESDFRELPSKEEARRRLGLPVNRPVVGRVSALARNKLPQEALEALAAIVKNVPNVLFAIVGDGPQRQAAEAWIAQQCLQESVTFLGERRDIPQVLRAFDVFAYYTTKDALGNVILEAVAAGVPVVTTDVEGTKEALGDAPGTLINLGDFDAFAAATKRWIEQEATVERSSFELPAKFTRSAMAASYRELYKQILMQPAIPNLHTKLPAQVTVLMPVFNARKDWLIEALDSIKHQTFTEWKLLLVDDGSKPEFNEWLLNTTSSDSILAVKARIIRLENNRGVAGALNAGLNACNTELVARMDADDRMRPDRLALQVAAFHQNPKLTVLGGWAQLIDENGTALDGRYSYPCGHRQIVQMLGSSCAFAHPTVMYRRTSILNVGGYKLECRHFEDYDLWIRMAEAGSQFANLPTMLLDYRVHGESVSHVHNATQSRGSSDCAKRAQLLDVGRRQSRRRRVIFTGVHHSYGIPGRGLSIEQLFFARALQHMVEIDLFRMPADDLIREHGQRRAGELLLSKAQEWRADMVFTVLGNPELDFLPEHIRALADMGVLTLNWNCDDHWRFPHTSKWAEHYSHMVTTDPLALKGFKAMGFERKIILKQWACNSIDYSPGTVKDIDVSFIGQPYGNRPAMVQAVRDSGIHIVVHGAGWESGNEIDFRQMIDILQRSRIVLNFSRATQGDRRQIKARFFEIPACAAFMLTESASEMENYLMPGRHYDTFDSEDELLEKIRHWLKHPARDTWALEASAIIRSIHTYPQRLCEVFETIGLYDRD
jgi:glycogen(starch) synthase